MCRGCVTHPIHSSLFPLERQLRGLVCQSSEISCTDTSFCSGTSQQGETLHSCHELAIQASFLSLSLRCTYVCLALQCMALDFRSVLLALGRGCLGKHSEPAAMHNYLFAPCTNFVFANTRSGIWQICTSTLLFQTSLCVGQIIHLQGSTRKLSSFYDHGDRGR